MTKTLPSTFSSVFTITAVFLGEVFLGDTFAGEALARDDLLDAAFLGDALLGVSLFVGDGAGFLLSVIGVLNSIVLLFGGGCGW